MPQAITVSPKTYRPALMTSLCDAVIRNPAHAHGSDTPEMKGCNETATVRFTVDDGLFIYVFKRCPKCAEILRIKARNTTLEILNEEVIDVTR